MITILRRTECAKNDYNLGYSIDEAYLDVEKWTVTRVSGSTNRKGKNLSTSTKFETPEQHGITRSTPIFRDSTVDINDQTFSLRVYYSDTDCYFHHIYPAGYMFNEIPSLPYKIIRLGIDAGGFDEMVERLIKKLERVLKGSFKSVDKSSINSLSNVVEMNLSELSSSLNSAKEYGLLDLVDYSKIETATGYKTYDEINEVIQLHEKKREEERVLIRKGHDEERKQLKIERHNEVISKIHEGKLNKFIYSINKGSLRVFSFSDDMVEVKSMRLSADQKLSDNCYYKIIKEGSINGFKYKEICILHFGQLYLETRVSWDFTIIESYNGLGLIIDLLK